MNYVGQAMMYNNLVKDIKYQVAEKRKELESIPEDRREDEVEFRLETLENIFILLNNDSSALYQNWRDMYREEQERESTTS